MKRLLIIILVVLAAVLICVSTPDPYAEKVKEFDKVLCEKLDDNEAGFSMLITHGNRIIYEKYHGYADIEKREELTKDHVLGIASMSKQFLGMMVVRLVDEGKLDLYEDIKTYLPDLPVGDRSITIKQLLSHTNGLPEITQNDVFMDSFSEPHSVQEIIDMAFLQDFRSEPGEKYQYSNTGYVIATKLVEELSGLSYATLLQKYIFNPLNMKNSYTADINFNSEDLPVPRYNQDSNAYLRSGKIHFSNMIGGGSILSNVRDIAKWNRALISGKKLPLSYRMIWEPTILNSGDSLNYGLGMGLENFNGHDLYYHPGSGEGMNSVNAVFPMEKIGIVVIQNANPPKINSTQVGLLACDYLFEAENKKIKSK